jgi:hypothetical protein
MMVAHNFFLNAIRANNSIFDCLKSFEFGFLLFFVIKRPKKDL